MKFGKVESAEGIDFSLPEDNIDTQLVLQNNGYTGQPTIYTGCSTWNKQTLKNFYPKGTKDELTYYSTQFNCIEMNASFYRIFPREQFEKWANKTPDDFKFFPKVYQGLSHWKRLQDCERYIEEYAYAVEGLGSKLGVCFLQMHNNFAPNQENIDRLEPFLEQWEATKIPLALELRHTDWHNHTPTNDYLTNLLTKYNVANIITDTAGRRDLIHMRLTTNSAFIRYVGANLNNDYQRTDAWVERFKKWSAIGIKNIYFFVHQNTDVETVNIARYFIGLMNKELGTTLKSPTTLTAQGSLF